MIALFDDKKAYIKQQAIEDIPVELNVKQWVNFLPPLVRPKPLTKEPLSESFKQTFAQHLKQGSKEQFADIDLAAEIDRFHLALFGKRFADLGGQLER